MRHAPNRRPGKTILLFVILLPVLLGWVGLALDGGALMAAHRQAQNAADAAALAAARVKLAGGTDAAARSEADTFIQQYNGLPGAPALVAGQTFNIPPSQGPFAGTADHVEVIVTAPVRTWFIHLVGAGPTQTVRGRAVASFAAVPVGVGAAVLDPRATPGLSLSGQGRLSINGKLVVNSEAAGYDEKGNYVNLGYGPYAVTTSNNSTLQAKDVSVVGGVDTPGNVRNLPGNSGSPLHAGSLPVPDPLLYLPTPTTANGVVNTNWGLTKSGQWQTFSTPQDVSVSVSGGTVTFSPGVYKSIKIQGGKGTVTFNPGIYVLAGGSSNSALSINGGATISGSGVMFYNTGSDYNPTTGGPDVNDGNSSPAPPASTKFGDVKINASNVNFAPINNANSPFDGMLFYQRRWNTMEFSTQGNGSSNVLAGTLYAKWANFKLSGQGTYKAQFIAGSMSVGGQADVTITYVNQKLGKARQLFLVE